MAKKTGARSKKGKSSATAEELEQYRKRVDAFERALKALHKGDLERARSLLEPLAAEPGDEPELGDRARTYLAICDRLARKGSPSSPRGFEELVTTGVFWHNEGDTDKAIKLLRKAVEQQPSSDYAQYCLAAAYARAGQLRDAAEHLRKAIEMDAYNRIVALSDPDFEALRQDDELAGVLGEPATAT